MRRRKRKKRRRSWIVVTMMLRIAVEMAWGCSLKGPCTSLVYTRTLKPLYGNPLKAKVHATEIHGPLKSS